MHPPCPTHRMRPLEGAVLACLLAPALLLAGCVAPRLTPESRVEPYASQRAAWDRRPREVLRLPVEVEGTAGEVALHRVRGERPGAARRPVLVLQPGLLATADTWRFLAGALDGACDLLLVDPPGVGESAGPDPGQASEHAYGPTWLAAHTLAALQALERREGTQGHYVLVGHSLGGAVVLRALADTTLRARYAPLLARVQGGVLFNPADIALSTRQEMFVTLTRLTDCEAGLGERLGLLRKQVREGVLANSPTGRRGALEGEAQRIEALLGRRSTRRVAQAMLRRFQPLEDDGLTRDGPAAERLAAEERAIPHPLLLLWGDEDRTFDPHVGEDIAGRVPGCRLVLLAGAGHSSHQDGAAEAAAQVLAFVEGLAPPGARAAAR